MKNNCILIVNPISGDIEKSTLVEDVNLFAQDKNKKLYVYTTSGKDDVEKIKALCELHDPERIIVAGGDGTIKMVAEAIEKIDIILGILPAGSANGLAADLNLPELINENFEIVFGNNYLEIDFISINNEKSIHLSDLGLNAQLIKNYEASTIRGKWGYAIQSLNTLTETNEPFIAKIVANNSTKVCEARMIVIANSNKYGSGIIINPDGRIDDGKFELVILKNLDLIVFTKIISGNMPINSDDVEIISTNKATISTNVPVYFQMDGEYCGKKTELSIEILPKQIKVAIP